MRPRADVLTGHCKAEADAIEEALDNNIEKGPWLDLFVSVLHVTQLELHSLQTFPAWHKLKEDYHSRNGFCFPADYGPRLRFPMLV